MLCDYACDDVSNKNVSNNITWVNSSVFVVVRFYNWNISLPFVINPKLMETKFAMQVCAGFIILEKRISKNYPLSATYS